MLKNQLYPFIEKYINEYLYGFTKEQLNVGVIKGIIALEGLNIRVDKVNEKLDNMEIPIWLKAGAIKKIRISCSLMNFIGEKPLDVNVEDIDLIICPSFKWIMKNLSTFIEENEYYIKEAYDPTDNNSHDIFSRKINIYDSSIIKKEKIFEIFSDPSFVAKILNKIFTKCLKFFYQKAYLLNLKFKNIHLRFEDDELINIFSDIGLGLKIDYLEINLSAEGGKKKNNFKCEKMCLYWEPKPSILIPSKKYKESLKEGQIDEKYYEYLKNVMVDLKNPNFSHKLYLIDNFNFMGNMGIIFIESGNLDLFSKREKNYKLLIQVATSELNLHIYPEILKISNRIADFMKSFYVIDPVQDFKPMRKPYNKLADLVKKMKNDPIFNDKRKRIVRDWIFYIIWYQRFKNAIYGKAFTNPLFSEFAKYFNICVVPNSDSKDALGNNFPNINDSFYMKKNEMSMIDPNLDKSGISYNIPGSSKNINSDAANAKEENLNPENINLSVFSEILLKSLNLHIHSKYLNNKNQDYFLFKLTGIELRSVLLKDKLETSIELKNIIVNNKIIYEINKNLDSKINDEIFNNMMDNHNHNMNMNYDKISMNNNFIESEKSLIMTKFQNTKKASLTGNAIQLNNNINDSFSSDVVFSSPAHQKKNNEENVLPHQHNIGINPFNSNQNYSMNNHIVKLENPKLNKRLNMIHQTLDKIKDKQNRNKQNENSFISYFLEENQPSGVIKDNASINSGLNSIQSIPTFNEIDPVFNNNQNPNQNLSKMINEYNKNKLIQKSKMSIVKIQPKISNTNSNPNFNFNSNKNLKNNPVTILKEVSGLMTANITNIAQKEKKISDQPVKNNNENANVKIPVNFFEIFPLNPNQNLSNVNDTFKTVTTNLSNSCLSIRISKSVVNKKPNLSVNMNIGIIRLSMLDKNLESALNILFDYKTENSLEKKLKENEKSFLFKNKLFGVADLNYNRQIYDMKYFVMHKLKNKIQSKEKEKQFFNPDNVEYYNYVKKDLDKYDHNFLNYGNFELNYLFSKFQSQSLEINLNLNEINIANLAFEDDTQKNIIRYGKIKIPKNFMKFSYTPQKHLSIKFFDFEIEFSESERLRRNLTEVIKILEEKLESQLGNVNLIFRPVIKKILEERRQAELSLKEKQDSKKLKNPNEKENSQINLNSNNQLNKKSSMKHIQSEFQKILNNNINVNNLNGDINNPLSNIGKLKNPFEEISDNTFNQMHISFEDDADIVKVTNDKKVSNQDVKEVSNIKLSGKKSEKISEEDKNNKNDFIQKKSPTNMKSTFGNNNNVRYEESIINPMKFSDDSEFFYNNVTDRQDKFIEPFPAKIFTDDHGENQKVIPNETKSKQDLKKKQSDSNGVFIGKYNK